MDSQLTPRPPVDIAAAQAAALVKAAGPSPQILPADYPATTNDISSLDGPPRFQLRPQQPLARPPYAQRAPLPPRHIFFARPGAPPPQSQPGQGPRFPPPYGPQGFPLGRPPFPPPGAGGPAFFRPQQQQPQPQPIPGDRRALLRPQISFDSARMAELAQEKLAAQQQGLSGQGQVVKLPELEQQSNPALVQPSHATNNEKRTPVEEQRQSDSSKNSRASSATPSKNGEQLEARPDSAKAPDIIESKPKTPDTSSVKGYDEGHRKSLTTPTPIPALVSTVVKDEEHASANKTSVPVAVPADTQEQPRDRQPTPAKADRAEPKLPIVKYPAVRPNQIKQDAENDSGVDESTQRREAPKSNGVSSRTPSKTRDVDKRSAAGSPIKSPSKSIRSLPKTPDAAPPTADKKKVPMNKVQVGAAPSPNLKAIRSKIGSLENATHKPGGGKIKIENRKLDFSSAQPKIAAKNDKYTPSGGDKKIEQVKLQWNAKPKIGSLDNATYKPGGGHKKIESIKLDFKDKAKPKVGSKENAKHVPGGGAVKSSETSPKTPQDNVVNIESQKLDFKAESKVGSMDNMKHRPGGGDKKIFDDKGYLRQTSSNVGSVSGDGSQVAPKRPNSLVGLSPGDKESSFDTPQTPPSTPTRSRNPSSLNTPRAIRAGFGQTPDTPTTGKKSLPGSPRKMN